MPPGIAAAHALLIWTAAALFVPILFAIDGLLAVHAAILTLTIVAHRTTVALRAIHAHRRP